MTNGLAKEAKCGGSVSFGCQQKVDGLTCSIYGVVQIFPPPFDFDVGFIHTPSTSNRPFMPTKHFVQQRHQVDNPAVKPGVVK